MLNEPPTFCQELELPAAAGSDLVYNEGEGLSQVHCYMKKGSIA